MTIAAKGDPERFIEWTIQQEINDCILWPYGQTPNGYAFIKRNNRRYRVSRIICERVYGTPPTMKHFASHCRPDGSACVGRHCINKRHLSWKTPKENSQDMFKHGTTNIGKHYNNELTESQVLEIRSRRGHEFQRITAKEFGITQSHVKDIQLKRRWKYLI